MADCFDQLDREDGAVVREDGRLVETLTMAHTGVHFNAKQREADERS